MEPKFLSKEEFKKEHGKSIEKEAMRIANKYNTHKTKFLRFYTLHFIWIFSLIALISLIILFINYSKSTKSGTFSNTLRSLLNSGSWQNIITQIIFWSYILFGVMLPLILRHLLFIDLNYKDLKLKSIENLFQFKDGFNEKLKWADKEALSLIDFKSNNETIKLVSELNIYNEKQENMKIQKINVYKEEIELYTKFERVSLTKYGEKTKANKTITNENAIMMELDIENKKFDNKVISFGFKSAHVDYTKMMKSLSIHNGDKKIEFYTNNKNKILEQEKINDLIKWLPKEEFGVIIENKKLKFYSKQSLFLLNLSTTVFNNTDKSKLYNFLETNLTDSLYEIYKISQIGNVISYSFI